MNQLKSARFQITLLLIIAGIFSRLIPHPPNFTALVATSMFGGFYLKNIKQAICVVLGAMLLSDLILGFHILMPVIYLTLLIPILFAHQLAQKSISIKWIVSGSIAASLLFFITTNLAVWGFTTLYPKTFPGLVSCYVAALPFLQNQIFGDLFYNSVIFGAFFILQIKFPILRTKFY